ncbi:CPXCG motif-containing cysteine-rich protein [Aidingimonas halophila]|uniref:CPXCG motif-containing cysteine-rich protein n=1 Tax=Aidingimonas halophila TaxID=574349 RepID=UPI000B033EF9|nr:CPXCG motif-containing cysteine-rich protein [Aidingimonas halophila]GHC24517.1 hypothetical protein GCM10008094_14490 [Aidingimonas halophila]
MHEEMLNTWAVTCPYCNTDFQLLVDASQGSHATWEDCPRCCSPIQVHVVVTQYGDLENVVLGRDDDVF